MKQILEIGKDSLRLGGEPFLLVSGSLHYFRILPGDWKRRLKLAKNFGLTAIQTYVPWNAHEPPSRGVRFLRNAGSGGLSGGSGRGGA